MIVHYVINRLFPIIFYFSFYISRCSVLNLQPLFAINSIWISSDPLISVCVRVCVCVRERERERERESNVEGRNGFFCLVVKDYYENSLVRQFT